MLSKNEIKNLSKYIRNVGFHYNIKALDDYQQEVLLVLLEKGEDFIDELKKEDKLYHYIYKICLFQILSVRSDFYRKYIFQQKFQDIDTIKQYKRELSFKTEKLIDVINSLDGVNSNLLKQLIECRGVTLMLSNKSNIAYSSLQRMIKKMKEEIKEKYNLSEFYE